MINYSIPYITPVVFGVRAGSTIDVKHTGIAGEHIIVINGKNLFEILECRAKI